MVRGGPTTQIFLEVQPNRSLEFKMATKSIFFFVKTSSKSNIKFSKSVSSLLR